MGKNKPRDYKEYLDKIFSSGNICPVCGEKKIIINKAEYVYKIDSKYYCSWTCYRKAQKELEEKKKKSNRIFRKQ